MNETVSKHFIVAFAINVRVAETKCYRLVHECTTYQMTATKMVLPQLHCTQHDYFSATYMNSIVAVAGINFSSPVDFAAIVAAAAVANRQRVRQRERQRGVLAC